MNRKVRGMVFTIISALLFGVTPHFGQYDL